jgi:hypothetical protein
MIKSELFLVKVLKLQLSFLFFLSLVVNWGRFREWVGFLGDFSDFLAFEPVTELVYAILLGFFTFFDFAIVSFAVPKVALELSIVKCSFIHKLYTLFGM